MPWINHLPPVCWSTFGILVWNDSGYVNLTQWWYFFIIFEYILHISTPHIMIFCFPLPYFPLSTNVYFLLSTLVLTLYIDVVLSLSINIFCNSVQNRHFSKFWPKSTISDNFYQHRDFMTKIYILVNFYQNQEFSIILTKMEIFLEFEPNSRFL